MSLFDFAKNAIMGSSSPQLPFTKGDLVSSPTPSCLWTIYNGRHKITNELVTVFSFDPAKYRQLLPLARNSIKRFRTIKHPLLPKYIDGVEVQTFIFNFTYIQTDTVITFATEHLTPLSNQLNLNKSNDDFICLGLYKVAVCTFFSQQKIVLLQSIIKFLNTDCSMVHGNIRVSSIFTTKAGEWKLCGFDVLSSIKESHSPISQFSSLIPNSMKYAPPEIQKSSWTSITRFTQKISVYSSIQLPSWRC